jgi:hypothetical protein
MTMLENSPIFDSSREHSSPANQPRSPRRFRRFVLHTLSLEAAWREVERIALGDVAKQSAVVVAAPRHGDDAAIATAEQGSGARQSMLWRWQR